MPEDYRGDDIYCDLILPGRVEVAVVKETSAVLAFHHTRPRWPIHIVVTSKAHIPSLLDLDARSASDMLEVVREVSAAVVAETGACRIVTNLGAYQDSKHLHFHVCSGSPHG
jgi:histidine triad (HIT) family protein